MQAFKKVHVNIYTSILGKI